jgi:hypothetical protein
MSLDVGKKLFKENPLPQDTLSPYLSPYPLLLDPGVDELPVFLLSLPSLCAELP